VTLLAPGSRRTGPQADQRPAKVRRRPAAESTARVRLAPTIGSGPADIRLLGPVGAVGAIVVLFVGLALQRTALPLLPWGPADLLTVLIVTLGLAFGPGVGCAYGFGAGLCADLLSDHTLGRLAAVLCVVGYLAGLVPAERGRRLRIAVPLIAVGCALVPLLFAVTGAFVGDTRAAGTLLLTRVAAGAAYGLIFGLISYPVVPRLVMARRSAGLRRLRTRVPG
jgi:rod shape-determining protein MreD